MNDNPGFESDDENSEAILAAMDSKSAENLRTLSQYDPDSAVGLMELLA